MFLWYSSWELTAKERAWALDHKDQKLIVFVGALASCSCIFPGGSAGKESACNTGDCLQGRIKGKIFHVHGSKELILSKWPYYLNPGVPNQLSVCGLLETRPHSRRWAMGKWVALYLPLPIFHITTWTTPSPWSMEKLSSLKLGPGAKKVGDH